MAAGPGPALRRLSSAPLPRVQPQPQLPVPRDLRLEGPGGPGGPGPVGPGLPPPDAAPVPRVGGMPGAPAPGGPPPDSIGLPPVDPGPIIGRAPGTPLPERRTGAPVAPTMGGVAAGGGGGGVLASPMSAGLSAPTSVGGPLTARPTSLGSLGPGIPANPNRPAPGPSPEELRRQRDEQTRLQNEARQRMIEQGRQTEYERQAREREQQQFVREAQQAEQERRAMEQARQDQLRQDQQLAQEREAQARFQQTEAERAAAERARDAELQQRQDRQLAAERAQQAARQQAEADRRFGLDDQQAQLDREMRERQARMNDELIRLARGDGGALPPVNPQDPASLGILRPGDGVTGAPVPGQRPGYEAPIGDWGPGGGMAPDQPVPRVGGGNTPAQTLIQDRAAQRTQGALAALERGMIDRGISGSTIHAGEANELVQQQGTDLLDADVQMAADDADRDFMREDRQWERGGQIDDRNYNAEQERQRRLLDLISGIRY